MERVCVDCNVKYTLPGEESRWTRGIGFRCEACFEKLDKAREEEEWRVAVAALRKTIMMDGLAGKDGCLYRDCWAASNQDIERDREGAYAVGAAYGRGEYRNAWICGPPGTGKTFLARCMINARIERGEYAGEVKAHAINGSALWDDAVRRYAAPTALLIDDIDVFDWTTKGWDVLRAVIDARYDARRDTIITAQRTGRAFAERVIECGIDRGSVLSMLDRMRAGNVAIVMDGKSLRG